MLSVLKEWWGATKNRQEEEPAPPDGSDTILPPLDAGDGAKMLRWWSGRSPLERREHLSTTYTWAAPGNGERGGITGSLLWWAVTQKAPALLHALVQECKRCGQEPLLEKESGIFSRTLLDEAVREAKPDLATVRVLLEAGCTIHEEEVSHAVFQRNTDLLEVLLSYWPEGVLLPPSVMKTASAVGASDAVANRLIEAGIAFDALDLLTNISFFPSSGTDADREKRAGRWLQAQEEHRSRKTAAFLDEALGPSDPMLRPRRSVRL